MIARTPAAAYVDTSCLVAIACDERGVDRLAKRLERYERLLSSNVTEAEFRSALAREQVSPPAEPLLSRIAWVLPDRPLSGELRRIAAAGGLRGADMWHLAHALYLAPEGKGLDFLTLDRRQQEVAAALGFRRPPAP